MIISKLQSLIVYTFSLKNFLLCSFQVIAVLRIEFWNFSCDFENLDCSFEFNFYDKNFSSLHKHILPKRLLVNLIVVNLCYWTKNLFSFQIAIKTKPRNKNEKKSHFLLNQFFIIFLNIIKIRWFEVLQVHCSALKSFDMHWKYRTNDEYYELDGNQN